MKRLRWLSVLMVFSILAITGFQLYWLKQNYSREEKALSIKTEVAFRETVQRLQVAKLKLDGLPIDSLNQGKVRVLMSNDSSEKINLRFSPGNEIVSTINVIRDKLSDSLKKTPGTKKEMVISMNNIIINGKGDTLKRRNNIPNWHNDHFYRFLYGVDSLQDSLKIKEIDLAYQKTLDHEKLNIPFTIIRLDSSRLDDDPAFNEVTVGFANPVTYRLNLGNSFPYLIRRITLPILFSILLLGITVVSFILLYKTLLKQQKLAVLKNEFISNITHELKTPIATVAVAIEALRNFGASQSPEKTKEYLDISASELQRLSLLVDKVLKLSMFENRDVELKKELFDMGALVNEVIQIMKLQFEKQHAEVNVSMTAGNFMIEADRLHIASVLYNLLDNALKYNNGNPIIDLQLTSLPGDIIELKVGDNGKGIPKEYQSRIFEKFFRMPQGNRHDIKGYGLGLSYVKEIVANHRGSIDVESQPGKGSTFTIRLPLKENDVVDLGNNRKIIKERIKFGK